MRKYVMERLSDFLKWQLAKTQSQVQHAGVLMLSSIFFPIFLSVIHFKTVNKSNLFPDYMEITPSKRISLYVIVYVDLFRHILE